MRWTPGRRSDNLQDMRGQTGGRTMGRGLPLGLGGLVLLLLLSLFTGRNFLEFAGPMLEQAPATQGPSDGGPVTASPEEEKLVDFMSFVLDDVQQVWHQQLGGRYQDTQLVLFRDGIRSACGIGQAATGPFYCPGDMKAYLDLAFFSELDRRFGAPGDFAQAYVVAHEIGHHVQNVLGLEGQMRQAQQRRPDLANELSVRFELQADCLAGVWGHSAAQRGRLDPNDIEEGLRAAAAIGDDRIQKMQTGYVSPERWTHGSSEQRVQWFRRGFDSGDIKACDTFGS
jgi:predicted metalloprotease